MDNVVYEIQIGPHKQIGSTNDVGRRMSEHLRALKKNKHPNRCMQGAYNKYKTFSYIILQSFLSRDAAYEYEQTLLSEYYCMPGYLMMSNKATGFPAGDAHPNKQVNRRQAASKRLALNNPMKDPIVREKKAATNKRLWQECPKEISYLRSEEVCKKRANSLKMYYAHNPKKQTGGDNPNAKKILNVETGEIYSTGRDAAVALGFKPAWISTLAKKGVKLMFI